MTRRIAKIVVSTSLDQDIFDRLDAFCNLNHRNRSEVMRGLLYSLLVDGKQDILGERVPTLEKRGNICNKDGHDNAARAVIKANADVSGTKLSWMLAEHDIKRSASWVNLRKAEAKKSGVFISG